VYLKSKTKPAWRAADDGRARAQAERHGSDAGAGERKIRRAHELAAYRNAPIGSPFYGLPQVAEDLGLG
jgi:hypothetical protein